MRSDLDGEQEIARGRALVAGTALATQPDLLAILDTDRDARRDPGTVGSAKSHGGSFDRVPEREGGPCLEVGAPARSWRGTKAPIALLTLPTGIRAALLSEHATEQVLDVRLPGATAAGARVEADVATAATCAAAEEVAEDVLEAGAAALGTGGEAGATVAHRADRVVLLALVGVGQDGIGLADLLEALLGRFVPRLLVRVQRAGKLAVGLLDRARVGVGGDAEDRVEVLLEPVLAGHRRLPSLTDILIRTPRRHRSWPE